jgi:hypothetical protein
MALTAETSSMVPETMMKGCRGRSSCMMLQGIARAEAGQRVVGEDEVPGLGLGEGVAQGVGGLDTAEVDGVTGARQDGGAAESVLLIVLDDEDAQRPGIRI